MKIEGKFQNGKYLLTFQKVVMAELKASWESKMNARIEKMETGSQGRLE
jgi:hypothetical protein